EVEWGKGRPGEAVRREVAVGYEGDVARNPGGVDREEHHRRRAGHAGATLEAHATDDEHAAALDVAVLDRRDGAEPVVVDDRRPAEARLPARLRPAELADLT